MMVLGVLLTLGLVFAGVLAGTVSRTASSRERGIANDLAEAGVRFAHNQLLNSELGGDWRPEFTLPAIDGQGFSKDPDALYLRPASNFPLRDDADAVLDRGGPDGLGPYTRMVFERGRALIRMRYAPSDFDLFGSPTGPLRQPGRARNYLIIESVGRSGPVRTNDPSIMLPESVKVTNYADAVEFRTEFGRAKRADQRFVDSRRLMAFASIGIIESARYITNRDRRSRPAEIGSITATANPSAEGDNLGVLYEDQPVALTQRWGGEYLPGATDLGTGSMHCNADLVIHGRHEVALNPNIGDTWTVAGKIRGANDAALVAFTRTSDGQTISLGNNTTRSLQSGRNTFTTFGGLLRDGVENPDAEGFSRASGYKEPPSIMRNDPASGQNRYLLMTRNSGAGFGRGNTGRMGYGRGVYVDCFERGNLPGEQERGDNEIARSLVNDWLNPGNPDSQGWQGPYYVPLAPYVELRPDGFVIVRDSRSSRRTWQTPQGDTHSSRCRFRLRTIGGVTYILNSYVRRDTRRMPDGLIDRPAQALSDDDFRTYGQIFNGVLFFEGDVRIRGVIPTHHQISVVSMGSIYVEGSITKGIVTESGQVINEPSRSMLMLMAKDFAVVNTTGFFSPGPSQDVRTKFASSGGVATTGLELGLDESQITRQQLDLHVQFLLDPLDATGRPVPDPTNWRPYALRYNQFGGGGPLESHALVTHWADDGGPSYVSMFNAAVTFNDLNPPASFYSPFLYPRQMDFASAGTITHNGAVRFFTTTGNVPVFGKGSSFPITEALPLVRPGTWTYANRRLEPTANNPEGRYVLATQDDTIVSLRMTSVGPFAAKNYVMSRFAIAPFDVRIEAALFAEEGSFFVIPGPPFNYNSTDTRSAFEARITALMNQGLSRPQAEDRARFERYTQIGAAPWVPFYLEPLDVRVVIFGAVSENMPAPISNQTEWQRRWGWIPRHLGASAALIPEEHVPSGYDLNNDRWVPNLVVNYDPALATAAVSDRNGVVAVPIRRNADGWVLPPMPRLPVSPSLAYFGEVNP